MKASKCGYLPEHPASDLFDALDESLWEALAVAASEKVVTTIPARVEQDRLVRMGLLFPMGGPTAAGYALLLAWHRRFQARRRWRKTRHETRMRLLWGG